MLKRARAQGGDLVVHWQGRRGRTTHPPGGAATAVLTWARCGRRRCSRSTAGPARRPADEKDGGASRWPRQAAGLAAALRAGLAVLSDGGPALDAVMAAVTVLEDDEQWNAGRGSALTAAGTVEMDAAVADGRARRFGGVACVTGVRHPVLAARAVMDDGRHVLLAGAGAEAFARRGRPGLRARSSGS